MVVIRNLLVIFLVYFSFQVDAMTTSGNQIIDSNGHPVELKGINWFGFNNGDTMTDGLWAGPDGLSLDFATVVYRLQLLGFNAVRLPFSFKDIYGLQPRDYRQNATAATQSQIQVSVTDPSIPIPPGLTIPPQHFPPNIVNPNVSNSYLPNDTCLNRFLWVINFFAKNGFYVLIDNHLREDQTVLQQGKAAWIQDWVKLVTAISNDPISRNMLMIDLLNEPDNFGIRWEASGNLPALKDLYLSAMDALYPINPKALFFIEGTGQGGIGANWGDGFATDPNLISHYGLSDPTSFFNTLLQKNYANQVVISPHVYPPTVTGATSNYSGTGLWNRLTSSFGYLTQQGYCNGSTCKVFPVAIGEFGSTFTDSRDLQSMPDIAAYLNNSGPAADGKHKKIDNWFYWAWNPNSGDTGGLVKDDWRQIIWKKLAYLTTIALTPWYQASPPPVEVGTLCISIAPATGLTKEALKPINVGDYTFAITDFNVPICHTVTVGSYSVQAPEIILDNKKFVAPAQNVSVTKDISSVAEIKYTGKEISNPISVIATVQMGTPWQESPGGPYHNVINLYFTNNGATAIDVPWHFTIKNSSYLSVDSSWNLHVDSVANGTISSTVPSSWQKLNPLGSGTVNVGLIVTSSSPSFLPTEVTVNGMPVGITVSQ